MTLHAARDVNVFFLWTNISFFCWPLEKKYISFRFRFWIQRKAKIRLFFINKKFVFISKCFIMFYSLKRTKYSLLLIILYFIIIIILLIQRFFLFLYIFIFLSISI